MRSLFSRRANAGRASSRRVSDRVGAGLRVEALENRFTPAVTIAGQGTDVVTITDDDSGSVNNSIQIIDDLDTLTTYIKINGGPAQALGKSGELLGDLTIDMGKGKDKVSFVVRGDTYNYDSDLSRYVNLGSGDDALSIDLGQGHDMASVGVYYTVFGDTSGNDRYDVRGEVINGCLWFDVVEASGSETYKFDLLARGSLLSIDVLDSSGNDKHAALLKSVNNGSEVSLQIHDELGNDGYSIGLTGENATDFFVEVVDGAGSDSYKLAVGPSRASQLHLNVKDATVAGSNSVEFRQGDLTGVVQVVALEFSGSAKNTVRFQGDAYLSSQSTVQTYYTGGDGVDDVRVDDDALAEGAYAYYTVLTEGGADRVVMEHDGSPRWRVPALSTGAAGNYVVNLGSGHDVFAATIDGERWRLQTPDQQFTRLFTTVFGGEGDDKLSFKTKDPDDPIRLLATYSQLEVFLQGEAGNDQIDFDIGRLQATGSLVRIFVMLDAGLGADNVNFGGTFINRAPGVTVLGRVDLGADMDRDYFQSSFKAADSVPLPLEVTFDFDLENFFANYDSVKLASGPRAPDYN